MLQLTAIGHLGQDAEVKNFGGRPVINFSVPHTKRYTKEGQPVKETIWIQCSKWTDNTKIAQYMRKGQLVCVIGEPSLRLYKNRENQTVAQMQMNVTHIELLGSQKRDEPTTATSAVEQNNSAHNQPQSFNDDLPF